MEFLLSREDHSGWAEDPNHILHSAVEFAPYT
jgi:hypothetical protein